MTTVKLNLGERSYAITVGRGILASVDKYIDLSRRVFILTDSGVPREYAETVSSLAEVSKIYTVPEGESSKSITVYEKVLLELMDFGMTRKDVLVSVGGGVVSDLGGFVASTYMRGIDFYNVPTTLLSQIDASIGGKCAVNLGSTKNTVGSFYQPKGVIIDLDTLNTLPARQFASGLAEALKMSMTSDAELFSILETEELTPENIERIVTRSLMIKKEVVEKDEKESGLRKILNFGHTLGHGIEAEEGLSGLYHGECVALGMIPMCDKSVRERLIPVLKKLDLPTKYNGDIEKALSYVGHDKKCAGDSLDAIFVDSIGSFRIERMTLDGFSSLIKERL
jgi:3-dehydroquinate synthase